VQKNVDALVFEQGVKCISHIFVLLRHQPLSASDHPHTAAESAHRLRELYSDIAAANDNQVFGNLVELQRLNMRQRLCLSETGNRVSSLARVPVLTITFVPRSRRMVPSARTTSTVLGATNRPVPSMNSAPVFL
jgi:hypothetical protein